MVRKAKRHRASSVERSGVRIPISIRVTPALKRRIDKATAISGRSQTQEIEFRIEQSFTVDELVNQFQTELKAQKEQTSTIVEAMRDTLAEIERVLGVKLGGGEK